MVRTKQTKCGQNKAELFPAFDSLAGKVPTRTRSFFAKPPMRCCQAMFLCFFPGVASVRATGCFLSVGKEDAMVLQHLQVTQRQHSQQ